MKQSQYIQELQEKYINNNNLSDVEIKEAIKYYNDLREIRIFYTSKDDVSTQYSHNFYKNKICYPIQYLSTDSFKDRLVKEYELKHPNRLVSFIYNHNHSECYYNSEHCVMVPDNLK